MIPREKIAEIMDATNIEEVVSEFVTLKRRGVNLLGLCPFHNEKTPSFTVSPAKGIFKCFGCGVSGNSVSFIMQHEHYSYPEALKYLASKYNIEVEEKEETAEEIQAKSDQESLYAITNFAQKHFEQNLWETQEGKNIGYAYFKERGYTNETIKHFQLGYSLKQWDGFTAQAQKAGYKKQYLEESGLSIYKTHQSYDRFRNRVTFPIHNVTGRVIGFGARILVKDKTKPKYLNSPESLIYNKRNTLYGIYFAKSEIVRENKCYLVEGYTDVISLYQAGIKNVVASSGTSLTENQIKLIKRYSNNITILYDGDNAGIKASFRGIDMILEQGMNVRVVLFEDGEDPDSFALSHTDSEISTYINENEKDFLQFKSSLLINETLNDPIKKGEAIEDISNSISLIPNMLIRDEYIKSTWESLGIDQQKLSYRVAVLRKKRQSKNTPQTPNEITTNPTVTSNVQQKITTTKSLDEDHMIRALVLYGRYLMDYQTEDENKISVSVAELIINEILYLNYEFKDITNQLIFDKCREMIEKGHIPNEDDFLASENQKIQEKTIHFVSEKYDLSKKWEEMLGMPVKTESDQYKLLVNDLIWNIKLKLLKEKLLDIENQLKDNHSENIEDLLIQYQKLKTDYSEINKTRGRIISDN